MTINVEEKIAKLDPVQRRKVEERAAELIAAEMRQHEFRSPPGSDAGERCRPEPGAPRPPPSLRIARFRWLNSTL